MIVRRVLPALLLLPLTTGCAGADAPSASGTPTSSPSASSSGPAASAAAPAASPTAASDSPVLRQGPDAVLKAARAGLVSAGSVHLSGSFAEKGTTVSVDMRVGRRGGRGSVTLNDQKIDIVALGDAVFSREDAAAYRAQGAGEAAKLLGGRWVKGSRTTKGFEQITSLSTLEGMSKDVR